MKESWCWDQNFPEDCPTQYQMTYQERYRYDGARQRYLVEVLHPSNQAVAIWSDYDDDDVYTDFTVSGPTATTTNRYEPGLWRNVNGISTYLHNDHLGTLRNTTNSGGTYDSASLRTYTAFGEPVAGPASFDRFGYVGAFGYQRRMGFDFLHVG